MVLTQPQELEAVHPGIWGGSGQAQGVRWSGARWAGLRRPRPLNPRGSLPLFHVPRCFQPCWEMQVPCVPLLWTNNGYPNSGLLFWLLPMADPAGATESRPVVHRFILTSASPRSPELLL